MNTKVLLIGNSARGHAIAATAAKSRHKPALFAYMKTNNPGIAALAQAVEIGEYRDLARIMSFVRAQGINLAVIDPEDPLKFGAADALERCGIPTVGPLKRLARIETSKTFARELMAKHNIPGSPKSRTFNDPYHSRRIKEYLEKIGPAVLKPDGLTGGHGVMVQGEHFATIDEALAICLSILQKHPSVVIEEKFSGEEFTLQCFTDGEIVIPLPLVQDHKRRLIGDQGLNTGGMGSYACANHLLPFLTQGELEQAIDIVRQTVAALYKETGELYRGIIYGGFMITRDGVKLIEFNARFGDPEAINVLSVLETDFLDICRRITCPEKYGRLDQLPISFRHRATVVKYVVPVNYGLPKDQWITTESDLIQIGDLGKAALYYSSVNSDQAGCHLTSSRAVAILGTANDLAEAERIAEQGARAIYGAVAHRSDIGTAALMARRTRHMEELRRAH